MDIRTQTHEFYFMTEPSYHIALVFKQLFLIAFAPQFRAWNFGRRHTHLCSSFFGSDVFVRGLLLL